MFTVIGLLFVIVARNMHVFALDSLVADPMVALGVFFFRDYTCFPIDGRVS
jgi:hypothetical protein